MYERKIPVDLDCPLRLTISLIDSKWKSCILDELRHRPLRPSELHKASLDIHSATPEFKKHVAEIEACGQMKLERFEF